MLSWFWGGHSGGAQGFPLALGSKGRRPGFEPTTLRMRGRRPPAVLDSGRRGVVLRPGRTDGRAAVAPRDRTRRDPPFPPPSSAARPGGGGGEHRAAPYRQRRHRRGGRRRHRRRRHVRGEASRLRAPSRRAETPEPPRGGRARPEPKPRWKDGDGDGVGGGGGGARSASQRAEKGPAPLADGRAAGPIGAPGHAPSCRRHKPARPRRHRSRGKSARPASLHN